MSEPWQDANATPIDELYPDTEQPGHRIDLGTIETDLDFKPSEPVPVEPFDPGGSPPGTEYRLREDVRFKPFPGTEPEPPPQSSAPPAGGGGRRALGRAQEQRQQPHGPQLLL